MALILSDAERVLGKVGAMAMLDDEFRARLEASPLEVLREFGMDVPGTPRIEIVTDAASIPGTPDEGTVVLYLPDALELTEEELSMVAGAVASCASSASTACTLILCLSSVTTAGTASCN